jgi:hypothetical protein
MMRKEQTMNAATVLDRMYDFARTTKDDKLSNAVMRVAERFAHSKALFEAPLTASEIRIVKKFMDL